MASSASSNKFLLLAIVLLFSPSTVMKCSSESQVLLQVSPSKFGDSVTSTITILRQAMSAISKFSGLVGDFRLSNAINDCLELMDMTIDELSWTLSASQEPNKMEISTGNLGHDMKTWLSGALVNQDTCREGLDGTNNGIVSSLISGSVDQVSSLIYDMLKMVVDTSPPPKNGGGGEGGRRLASGGGKFPRWIKSHDRKLLQPTNVDGANVVVAQDGTGNYTTIVDAIRDAPDFSHERYVVYVKKGVYEEYVEVGKKKWNIMLIGDGIDATVITGNRNYVDGWTTYRSATFAVKGQGFIARDITFENTAGPEKHQAVAYRTDSDLSVLYRCAIKGFQDTLYAHSQRQFYRECEIYGTVDFIFGDGAVVFQNCLLTAIQGLPSQKNMITAQGRTDPLENTGFSIQYCNITVDSGVLNTTETYLGRPWKLYSRTVVMQSYISGAIRPEGWLEWNGDFALDTLFYGEYMNYGPGSGLESRVRWPGYRVFNSSDEASNFTVSRFIIGNSWLPSTGVKYTADLAA